MYAVTVTFILKEGQAARLLPLLHENAATSLREEEGCHRFDVCTDISRPDEVFLYELYTDPAAFQAHLVSPHFKAFDAATAEMIQEKRVALFGGVWP